MKIEKLDHFTINVSDLNVSIQFYSKIVGLRIGSRPNFSFNGAWLYCGDVPVVHLIDDEARRGKRRVRGEVGIHGMGAIDHVAFRAVGIDAMRKRLLKMDVEFDEQSVPGQATQQLFLDDPDGVRLEFNFPSSEVR